MRVGMIGTGAISHKHAQAYRNIGYQIAAACDVAPGRAAQFCEQYGGEPVETWQDVCRHPRVDFVDVCTFPDFRLEPIELVRDHQKTCAGAEADRDESGHCEGHGGARRARRHFVERGEPASF